MPPWVPENHFVIAPFKKFFGHPSGTGFSPSTVVQYLDTLRCLILGCLILGLHLFRAFK